MKRPIIALIVGLALAVLSTSSAGETVLAKPFVNLPPPQSVPAAPSQYDTSLDSHLLEVNNKFSAAADPWDWEVLNADYYLRVKEDFTAGQVIEFAVSGSTIHLQPMELQWANPLQIQPISMPQDVTPVVINREVNRNGTTKYEGTIVWEDSYGSGLDFEWKSTPYELNKTLTIDSLTSLPELEEYIIDGGNPFLRLNLIFDPSSDLDIYVDGSLWDTKTKVTTFEAIEFKKNGDTRWSFKPLMYWDSNGNEGQSVATLEKSGNSLYISIRVPYSWLQLAVYPVFIDADIQIDASIHVVQYTSARRGGIFWTSPTVGYVIYGDANRDLVYQKTADGGATWGGQVQLVAPGSCHATQWDSYADWQTDGDAGTKIHTVYISDDEDEARYVYLDTSDDSVGGDVLIETTPGTGEVDSSYGFPVQADSITKTRGGNFGVTIKQRDSNNVEFTSFYTSPDADTWTEEADPYETDADFVQLYPGNEADNQDIWAIYWDADADAISLKTYDDSGNSWSEQAIAGSMEEPGFYKQSCGDIRLSDGHLILAAWSEFDSATADLKVWDINGAGSITAKTDVVTNSGESAVVAVFINQDNDDIYVAYIKGPQLVSNVQVFYQLSQDGGANWDGQTAMQADVGDDMKWISSGAVKAAWGGKYLPVFVNDDLNDLFCNTDNGISIAASAGVVAPTVTSDNSSLVEETTATLSGNITATGGANATDRMFHYGTSTGVYTDNVTEAGNFGVGIFNNNLAGLTKGELYYWVASANNSAGRGYGSELTFLTKPDPATNFTSSANATTSVNLTWTNGTGMDYVEIRYDTGSAPADNVSGSAGFWGNDTSANISGLSSGTTYFFTIFTHATEGGLWSTADGNPNCQDDTDTIVVPTVVTGGAMLIEETTATLQGNITVTGGENSTEQLFQWDTDSGVPYTDNWTNSGNFGSGNFTNGLTGLTKGELYYFRAGANNTAGIGYGSEVTFLTKPDPAASFNSTDNGTAWIMLGWINGTGMDYVEILYQEGSAPGDNVTGTLGFWGNDTSANITGLNASTTYFFTIFTHANEGGLWSTADNNPDCQDTTDAAPIVTPTVVTGGAMTVEETTATLQGNITNIGGENCTEQIFWWDVDTGSPYTDNWTNSGNFGTGNFTHGITGLTIGELYFVLAGANNTAGIGTGSEITFLTKPNPATSFNSTDNGTTWIYLGWVNGTGMDYVEVRYNTGSAPTNNTTGTLGFWGNGTTANVTGLTPGTTYFFTVFTHVTEGGLWSTSDNSPSTQDDTDVAPPAPPSEGAEGSTMLLTLLGSVAVILTCAMFYGKEPMLGFPSALFWALTGGQSFALSTTTWDIYYLIGFGLLLGMTTFTILAAFALREKHDAEGEGSVDVGSSIESKDLDGGQLI